MSKRIAVALGLLVAVAVCAFAWTGLAQGRGPLTVENILSQMDAQAKTFHSLSANVERTKVTVVVNDRSTETGSMLVRDDKMLLEMNAPDSRTILRVGDSLSVYTPGLKQLQEYSLGKNRDTFEQFVLLGFGTSGTDLQKGYSIALLGEPTLDDKKTAELELTPKSKTVLGQIAKVQIWLDETSWLAAQQQIYETGSGDYSIVRYSKVVLNPKIPDSRFKPHWPKGTSVVKPQS